MKEIQSFDTSGTLQSTEQCHIPKDCIFNSITVRKSALPIHINSKSSFTIIIFNFLSSGKNHNSGLWQ